MKLYLVDTQGKLQSSQVTDADLEDMLIDTDQSWYFSSPSKAYAQALQRHKLSLAFRRNQLKKAERYVNNCKAVIAQIKLGVKELKKC